MRKIAFAVAFILPGMLFINLCKRPSASITTRPFGTTLLGDSVTLYRLTNHSGAYMEVIDYGCRVLDINVPDRNGTLDDVVPGYGSLKDFELGDERFFGALLGRYANRIADGRFMLDGNDYQLTCNEVIDGRPGHLHGGKRGFDRVMWHAEPYSCGDTVGVRFSRLSPDEEEGYPGNLLCTVTYSWTPSNTWRIEYRATTDKPTIVNMSQHCYFNLKGRKGGTVLEHYLMVDADSMTPNNHYYIPKGDIVSVEGTPFDFRTYRKFPQKVDESNEHMRIMKGFSLNWVLNNQSGSLRRASVLYDPSSGRTMETWTTEPGLLVYTGRGLSEKIIGKGNKPINQYGGLIMETIHYPDTPNHPNFPPCVLRPDEQYYSVTEYRFGIGYNVIQGEE
ncbi:MAG: aldose epimerase family protein [Mangrovibacterium sp.]